MRRRRLRLRWGGMGDSNFSQQAGKLVGLRMIPFGRFSRAYGTGISFFRSPASALAGYFQ